MIKEIDKFEGIVTLEISKRVWMEHWGEIFDTLKNRIAEIPLVTTDDKIDIKYVLNAHIRNKGE